MQEFIFQINSIKMKYFQARDKIDLTNFSEREFFFICKNTHIFFFLF